MNKIVFLKVEIYSENKLKFHFPQKIGKAFSGIIQRKYRQSFMQSSSSFAIALGLLQRPPFGFHIRKRRQSETMNFSILGTRKTLGIPNFINAEAELILFLVKKIRETIKNELDFIMM